MEKACWLLEKTTDKILDAFWLLKQVCTHANTPAAKHTELLEGKIGGQSPGGAIGASSASSASSSTSGISGRAAAASVTTAMYAPPVLVSEAHTATACAEHTSHVTAVKILLKKLLLVAFYCGAILEL